MVLFKIQRNLPVFCCLVTSSLNAFLSWRLLIGWSTAWFIPYLFLHLLPFFFPLFWATRVPQIRQKPWMFVASHVLVVAFNLLYYPIAVFTATYGSYDMIACLYCITCSAYMAALGVQQLNHTYQIFLISLRPIFCTDYILNLVFFTWLAVLTPQLTMSQFERDPADARYKTHTIIMLEVLVVSLGVFSYTMMVAFNSKTFGFYGKHPDVAGECSGVLVQERGGEWVLDVGILTRHPFDKELEFRRTALNC